jgi:Fe-S-cluster containining protein
MKRNCSLDEISDGKLYDLEDLVEASCNGCKGEASCCHGMGKSIILDPYDIYRLTTNLDTTFEGLLVDKIELNVVDGIILPNLKMEGTMEACSFLNTQGRCTIHGFRPGICRVFPLGRYYENHGFKYFLQVNECPNNIATKRKVINWIDTPDIKQNEQFLTDWHYFINDMEVIIKNTKEDNQIRNINMYLLNAFYLKKYVGDRDFYSQFYYRLAEVKKVIG